MKATVYRENGPPDVLQLEEIEKPAPTEDEVLIKIRAVSINPLDWRLMRGGPAPIRILLSLFRRGAARPGVDFAGVVEALGSKVTTFKAGDAVFGACRGALAEYACAPAGNLSAKPVNISFEKAASVPVAGLTALQGLRDRGRIRTGDRVLINGASGGVGTFAVQIARNSGAEVTAVCSTRNINMVRSLGASHVIDYTRESIAADAAGYDVILDNVGNLPLTLCRRMLKPGGRCVIVGASKQASRILTHALGAVILSRLVSQNFIFFIAKVNAGDLATLARELQSGRIKALIDRQYKLSEVREAFRYLEEGHASGKVVISVAES